MSDPASRSVVALSSSPRRRGNSRVLAEALLEGAAEAGHRVKLIHLADHVQSMLRNCRECRRPDGTCSIEDGYRGIFLDDFLPADAVVLATPIWWYGMSAHLKNFLDRMFCYYALSNPDHADVQRRMVNKRLALVLSAEESNLSARLGIVHQVQELSRYLHYTFAGVVTGIGNSTAEVRRDPADPLEQARILGRRLFEIRETDYKLDVERSPRVWEDGDPYFPTTWR